MLNKQILCQRFNSHARCLCLQSGCVKSEEGEGCENRPNLRRRMGSFVAKPEPGEHLTSHDSQIFSSLYLQSIMQSKHDQHSFQSNQCPYINKCVCMCVLEREIPIQVKQEPVEIHELNPEPEKANHVTRKISSLLQ